VASSATSMDTLAVDTSDPAYAEFASILGKFQEQAVDGSGPVDSGPSKGEIYYSDEEDEDEEEAAARKKQYEQDGLTRRQRRAAAVCLWN